jgi:hypothetical protein
MIGVVYHTYLINDWKDVVSNQLLRLKKSGLYDACDVIWVTVNLNGNSEDDFNNVVKQYSKLKKDFHINNGAEYPGIKKVRELCSLYSDLKVLYFHTKGVNNKYKIYNEKEISEEKVNNIKAWKECLEYFLIDNWKDCVEKLNDYDNVGVTCNNGWFWGNFWWSQPKHILKTREVDYWSRWSYEAWMNDYVEGPIKNFEYYKFLYNPYVTYIDEQWYKNPEKYKSSKIILHKAEYGTGDFEIDEGYTNSILNKTVDVTEIVKEFLEKEKNLKFNISVNNESLGGDPISNNRKFLFIWFSLDVDKDKIYKIGVNEGQHLILEF